MNKKSLVLIPSAYNHKVMGDIEQFIKFYKTKFNLYIISDEFEDELVKKENINYVNNKSFFAEYLRFTADYIIDAGSINGTSKISKSQKRISVWHGIPYKNMFVDLDPKYYSTALEYDYGIDLMVSPSKFYTNEFLRKSMLYTGKILETSVSRTDSLFLTEKQKERVKKELNIPKNKKILLYAPTFRKEGEFNLPFDPQEVLNNLPKHEWIIVTKLHYLNNLKNVNDNIIDATNYPVINNLLAISDALITDYSSLFFDYSVLTKPSIFYQYDKDEYSSSRGFMFELETYVDKKYIIESENELYNLISDLPKMKPNLNKIKNEFYPHQEKNSTEKLVKELNLDNTERKTKDIIFLVNDLNQIGGIHNFVLNLAKEFKEKYNSKIIVIGKNEFAKSNEKIHFFDQDNIIDIKISKEKNPYITRCILTNTDGYIIGCQFAAFMSMQKYLKNKKAVVMFHGDTEDIVTKKYYATHLETINTKLIDNYQKLVLLTKGNMQTLSKAVTDEIKPKLSYIENGFDFTKIKNFYKNNGDFVCVTRLDNDKNPQDIIKIFSNPKLNKNYKVHVYGDGELKSELEKEIKEKKLEDKIILHGYCNNKEEIYKDKQGLIMTSLTEGFPYIILEAYKYGIPIYTYNSFTAVQDLVNNKIGRIVKTSNIEDYVKVLNENINIDNKNFSTFISKFSNEAILKKWINLFEELDKINFTIKKDENTVIEKKKYNISKNIKKKKNKKVKKLKNKFLTSDSKKISDIYIIIKNIMYTTKNIFKKKKKPLVSIIVPFYNNNKTLNNTLKSIKKCKYKNYEVLLINDGSKENPEKIYKKYKNIKYYYKDNEGLGETRNFGINHASGKYIFFLDSDDEICPGSLNHLVDYAEENNLNLVSGICRRIYYNTKSTSYWYLNIYRKKNINNQEERYRIFSDTISTSKLYNLKELKKQNIKFVSGLYEDVLFMGEVYNKIDRVGIIPSIVYTWYVYGKNTTITTSLTINNLKERIAKFNGVLNIVSDHDKIYYMNNFIRHHMYIYINNFNEYTEKEKKEIYELIRKELLDYKEYIYEKFIRAPEKKYIVELILNDNYKEFYNIATYISKSFSKILEKLNNKQ